MGRSCSPAPAPNPFPGPQRVDQGSLSLRRPQSDICCRKRDCGSSRPSAASASAPSGSRPPSRRRRAARARPWPAVISASPSVPNAARAASGRRPAAAPQLLPASRRRSRRASRLRRPRRRAPFFASARSSRFSAVWIRRYGSRTAVRLVTRGGGCAAPALRARGRRESLAHPSRRSRARCSRSGPSASSGPRSRLGITTLLYFARSARATGSPDSRTFSGETMKRASQS